MKRIVCFHSDVDFGVMTHLPHGREATASPKQPAKEPTWGSDMSLVKMEISRTLFQFIDYQIAKFRFTI